MPDSAFSRVPVESALKSATDGSMAAMGLFSRRAGAGRTGVVPVSMIASLPDYGRAVIAAKRSHAPVTDPRFGWDWLSQAVLPMNSPQRDQVIQELYDAAVSAEDRPMATVGAYRVLCEWDGNLQDPRFAELRDAYLQLLHQMRFTSLELTGYESARWIELHGDLRHSFDRIVDVKVDPAALPPAAELAPGQSKLLLRMGPSSQDNEFYGERSANGLYGLYCIGISSSDDPTKVRYDWPDIIPCATMQELLVQVGRRFGTRPYWADPVLEPYFTGRRQ